MTEQQTTTHARSLTRIADHLALQTPTETITQQQLDRAIRVAGVTRDNKPAITALLPDHNPDTTIGQYVGHLRQAARELQ